MAGAALAGCIGGGETTGTGDGPAGPDVQFTEDTGAITGVVQNEELLPIEGAVVGTKEGDLEATTDADGFYAISNVEPGEYSLFVQAIGYESTVANVEVVAGSAVEANFQLSQVASDEPYHTFQTADLVVSGILWKLTPECIYTDVDPLVKTCGGVRFGSFAPGGQTVFQGCDACETHLYHQQDDEDPAPALTNEDHWEHWQTIIVELTWEPQSGATGRGFFLDLNAPNVTRGRGGSINQASPYTWVQSSDQAPIVHRVDLPTSLEERGIPQADWYPYEDEDGCTAPNEGFSNCDWFFRIFPAPCDLGICEDGFGPDYGIMIEARSSVYWSVFVKDTAPPDYTNLPDE